MNQMLAQQITKAKKKGLSDKEIGNKYGVNLKFIEKAITQEMGVNVSNPQQLKKTNRRMSPQNFEFEKKTVWSFKSRGNWATHNGNYRGNWSPYIPRNIILRYSKENDLVLDYFCGAGTTGIECKLLHRNFLGLDINPQAIELAKGNLDFEDYSLFEEKFKGKIDFRVGDARNLQQMDNGSIDLICAHPPYANIIHYTDENPSDLSNYQATEFLEQVEKVAAESYRVLKNNRFCAILIGDMRKNKNVIPLGFWTIQKFLNARFRLKELIIKRQHNCKTTGFWYTNSIKYNFLLLAHEYLAVFQKVRALPRIHDVALDYQANRPKVDKNIALESTTVWLFDSGNWMRKTISNIVKRYSLQNYILFEVKLLRKKNLDLIIHRYSEDTFSACIDFAASNLAGNGILAIVCEDKRSEDGLILPIALQIEKKLRNHRALKIKELVIVSIENGGTEQTDNNLHINHKYVLVYRRVENEQL